MSVPDFESSPSMPFELLRLGFELAWLGLETQAVIAMRLAGFGGFWRVGPDESSRMVMEKPVSFAAATSAAMVAASLGQRPDQVMSAAVAPLRDRTAANAKRLGKAGARFGMF